MPRRFTLAALVLAAALTAVFTASGAAEAGPVAGTAYAPARAFVARYCADCHWEGGTNAKKKRARPALRLDTYEDWRRHQSALKGVLDKWHPDGKLMPPKDAKQPADAERRVILEWLARGSPNTANGR